MRTAQLTRALPGIICIALLFSASAPTDAFAQSDAQRRLTVVPMLGFGALLVNETLGSAGMETAVALEYGNTDWRATSFASLRGLGVSCSHACFTGGPALALGAARSVGELWIGAGVGVMKQFGEWRLLPYGRVALDVASLRLEVRVEDPQHRGSGVYIPFLVGFPISP